VAGWLSDRFPKRYIMAACDVLRMLLVLLYLTVQPDTYWVLYLLGFIQHSLSALFDPAFQATIPEHVPRESLHHAHTIMTTLWAIVVTLASVAGGAVVAYAGAVPNFVADSTCYALSFGLVIYLIRTLANSDDVPNPKQDPEEDDSKESTQSTSSEEEEDQSLNEGTADSETESHSSILEAARGVISYIRSEPYLMILSGVRLLDALGYGAVSLVSIKLVEDELFFEGADSSVTLGVLYFVLGLSSCTSLRQSFSFFGMFNPILFPP